MIYFCADLHGVGEVTGSCGKHHDLLEGHAVASVFATVDDVEGRSGKDVFRSCWQFSQGFEVWVEGDVFGSCSCSGHCQGNWKDGVGSDFAFAEAELVLGSVDHLDHMVVDIVLSHWVPSFQSWGKDVVHIVDGLGNPFSHVLAVDFVSEFKGLVFACGCSWGDSCSEESQVGDDVGFDGGVASGVEDLSGSDLLDGGGLLGEGGGKIFQHFISNVIFINFLPFITPISHFLCYGHIDRKKLERGKCIIILAKWRYNIKWV